jgi:hypothetical protein
MGDDVTAVPGQGADLLTELRQAWEQHDPPPAGLTERVRFALEVEHLTRDLDVELMRLQQESLVGAGSRGDEVRTVTFGSRTLTVMLAISDVDGGYRIDGWVAPGGRRAVEVRTSEGTSQEHCDDTGRFCLDRVPPGHLQLVLATIDGDPAAEGGRVATGVVTPALTL